MCVECALSVSVDQSRVVLEGCEGNEGCARRAGVRARQLWRLQCNKARRGVSVFNAGSSIYRLYRQDSKALLKVRLFKSGDGDATRR